MEHHVSTDSDEQARRRRRRGVGGSSCGLAHDASPSAQVATANMDWEHIADPQRHAYSARTSSVNGPFTVSP